MTRMRLPEDNTLMKSFDDGAELVEDIRRTKDPSPLGAVSFVNMYSNQYYYATTQQTIYNSTTQLSTFNNTTQIYYLSTQHAATHAPYTGDDPLHMYYATTQHAKHHAPYAGGSDPLHMYYATTQHKHVQTDTEGLFGYYASSTAAAGAGSIMFFASTKLSAAAAAVIVSGLDQNAVGFLVEATAAGTDTSPRNFIIQLNNDATTSRYVTQFLIANDATLTGARYTASAGVVGGYYMPTNHMEYYRVALRKADTASVGGLQCLSGAPSFSTGVWSMQQGVGIWSCATEKINSIKLYPESAGSISQNSVFHFYKVMQA